ERLRVAFNDVDLTMRIHQLGYDLIYQPNANLLHQESALRGSLHPMEDENFFRERWGEPLRQDDPYYNPRLSRHAQYYFHDEVKQVWLPRGHPLA
ncbi:MAG: glycosyltransferase family 2 protein, partial [Acidimicrobiales bacterium]